MGKREKIMGKIKGGKKGKSKRETEKGKGEMEKRKGKRKNLREEGSKLSTLKILLLMSLKRLHLTFFHLNVAFDILHISAGWDNFT